MNQVALGIRLMENVNHYLTNQDHRRTRILRERLVSALFFVFCKKGKSPLFSQKTSLCLLQHFSFFASKKITRSSGATAWVRSQAFPAVSGACRVHLSRSDPLR